MRLLVVIHDVLPNNMQPSTEMSGSWPAAKHRKEVSHISSGEGPLCSGQCGITYFGYQSYSIIWFMNSYFSHEIISITKAPPSGGGSGNKSTLCSIHMAYSPWPLSLFSFVTWLSGLCNADYLWQSLVKPNVFVMERGEKKAMLHSLPVGQVLLSPNVMVFASLFLCVILTARWQQK